MKDTPSSGISHDPEPALDKNRVNESQLKDICHKIDNQQAELEQLRTEIKSTIKAEALNTARQLEAFYQLYSLIGDVPDSLHGWPISPDFALKLVRQIQGQDYDLIVEFGSGISTYLELRSLETWTRPSSSEKDPKLVVFEHLDTYLQQTMNLVESCPLKHRADLSLRPLESWKDASGAYTFYSGTDIIAKVLRAKHSRKKLLPQKTHDSSLKLLVVIDGPPGTTCPWARYPAIPIVLDACNGLAVAIDFLLDDVIRFDEREMASAWESIMQSLEISYTRHNLHFEKGGMLIHVPSLKEQITSRSSPNQIGLTHDNEQEKIARRLETLQLECDRRYGAIRLSQEQEIRIAELEKQLAEAQHTTLELRSQIEIQANALNDLAPISDFDHDRVPPTPNPSNSSDKQRELRDENLLLQLQLQQVQEELEHYALLSKGVPPEAPPAACKPLDEVAEMLPVSPTNMKTDRDTINDNRAFLQTST